MNLSPRRWVERLSRGWTYRRRLPTPFESVKIWVTPDACLAYLKPGRGWCDSELLDMADRHITPGSTVWDIGANVGIFAAAAAFH